jgi:hypothetical protein
VNLRRLADSTLLVVSIVYGSGLLFGKLGGVLGWPLLALLALSLWRYSYALLGDVARDRPVLPAPDVETLHPFGEVRLVAHFILFPGSLLALTLAHPQLTGVADTALWWLALIVLTAAFPASGAIVGISGSLPAALHPGHVITLIGTMGWRYVTLLAMCAALLLPGIALIIALQDAGWIAQWLAACLAVWLLLSVFVLTGSVVSEFRDELDIASPADLSAAAQQRQWDRDHLLVLDLAYAALRSGFTAQGYATLKQMLTEEGDDPALYQWVLNRMSEWEDQSHARAVAARFVARLLDLGRTHEALEIAETHRRRSPEFRLPAGHVLPLAGYAREIGHQWLADELIADLRDAPDP